MIASQSDASTLVPRQYASPHDARYGPWCGDDGAKWTVHLHYLLSASSFHLNACTLHTGEAGLDLAQPKCLYLIMERYAVDAILLSYCDATLKVIVFFWFSFFAFCVKF